MGVEIVGLAARGRDRWSGSNPRPLLIVHRSRHAGSPKSLFCRAGQNTAQTEHDKGRDGLSK